MGKLLLLTLNEYEEKVIDKIIAAISDYISLESMQTIPVPASVLSFPGLEIRLHPTIPNKRTKDQKQALWKCA